MPLEGAVAQRIALVDVVNGLLDKGTVINGQATVSLAGVDLVHVALNLLVTSVETLRQSTAPPLNNPSGPPSPLPAPRSPSPAHEAGSAGAFSSVAVLPPPFERWSEPHPPAGGGLLMADSASVPQPQTPAERDQGLAGLVLALVELIRQLLERQAVRRMEGGALTEDEVERMGRALMELNGKMKELFTIFGLDETDVNLDLGPLGQLL